MLILSIKPKYVKQILNKSKQVEFRKATLRSPEKTVFIYSSSPQQEVVGFFRYKNITEDSPENIWKRYKDIGGIDKISFFKYYQGKTTAFAIEIDEVKPFARAIKPAELDSFTPPQSFQYVDFSRWKPLEIAMMM